MSVRSLVVVFVVVAVGCSSTSSQQKREAADASEAKSGEGARVVDVWTGTQRTYAQTSDGAVYAWGSNFYVDGEGRDFHEPKARDYGVDLRGIDAARRTACGIDPAKRVRCWGMNLRNRLGDSSEESRAEPRPIESKARFQKVSVGKRTTCALDVEGYVHCWGENRGGSLGRGGTNGTGGPAKVDGDQTFVDVEVYDAHACALTEKGRAFCWGKIELSEPENGSKKNRRKRAYYNRATPTPAAVEQGDLHFTKLWAGHGDATCATEQSGEIYCWGDLRYVQPGELNKRNIAATPQLLEVEPAMVQLALGTQHICGLSAEGKAYCWGRNEVPRGGRYNGGQLGDGTTENRKEPTPVATERTFSKLVAGSGHTCGLTDGGQLYCWGDDLEGAVGDGRPRSRRLPSPASTRWSSGPRRFMDVWHGRAHYCGLTPSAELYCSGANRNGSVGAGLEDEQIDKPVAVKGDYKFDQVHVAEDTVCGLTRAGRVYCWGHNRSGRVGDGTSEKRRAPVPIATETRFVKLGGGADEICAIDRDGKPWCWGFRADKTTRRVPYKERHKFGIPRPIATDESFVTAGDGCGLTEAGALYCWTANREKVERVAGDLTFASSVQGNHYQCALTTDGEAYCWGRNYLGRLGDGTAEHRKEPVAVETDVRFSRLVLGRRFACGLTDEGRAYCWGDNAFGTLGNGETRTKSYAPQKVAGDHRFETLVTGRYRYGSNEEFICGLDPAGKAYCWGLGQLTPQPFLPDYRFSKLLQVGHRGAAMTKDGRVLAWRYRTVEQGGPKVDVDNKPTPVLVRIP